MGTDGHEVPGLDVEETKRARDEELLHRQLQQQGDDATDSTVPRRERERHDAIDEAVEDAERSVRHAAERREQEAREQGTDA